MTSQTSKQNTDPTVVNVQSVLNESPFSGFQWGIFALCFLIVLLDGFDTAAIGFIAPSLLSEWNLDKSHLGPVLSAALLGLSLAVRDPRMQEADKPGARSTVLVRAARTASVSNRQAMAPTKLRKILMAGTAAPDDAPYLHALLDDAPISLLASLAGQLHRESGMDRAQAWRHFRQLAHQVLSKRDIWQ